MLRSSFTTGETYNVLRVFYLSYVYVCVYACIRGGA